MNIDELASYDNLKDDARKILNSAMDVYWYIKDIEIKRKVKDLYNNEDEYVFTEIDKKIISLYLACFLVDTDLKKKLSEYKDISEKNILSFLGIEKENIKPLYYESYKPFYEMEFKNIIKDMLQRKQKFFETKKIDSQVVYFLMRDIKISGSNILNYLSSYCTNEKFLCKHPSFDEVGKSIITSEKNQGIKNMPNDEKNIKSNITDNNGEDFSNFNKDEFWFDKTYEHTLKPRSEKENAKLNVSKETLRRFDIISKKYICQGKALNELIASIINNQFASRVDDGLLKRRIIFLNGTPGTGKKTITKELLESLMLPSCYVSLKNYFSFFDRNSILRNLYQASYGNMEKAQKGVVVYDEGLKGDGLIAMQALELLKGKTYRINVGSQSVPIYVDFDTSKLTFIFIDNLLKKDTELSTSKEDLVSNGYDLKLAEKINTYIDTKRYSKEDFIAILNNSTISPILKLQNWVSSMNKTLKIDSGAIEKISAIAYNLGLEFNGLETLIYRMRTQLMGNVLFGEEKEIYLNAESIDSIYSSLNTGRHI